MQDFIHFYLIILLHFYISTNNELNCDGTSSLKYCRDDITEGYLSDKTSGTAKWYNGQNNTQNGTYNYNKNIKSNSIDKIANVRWNLGGANYVASALNFYNQERGTNHVSNPSDNIPRTTTWDGKIALIYPSDFGYSSTNTTCRSGLSTTNCKENNWLYIEVSHQWTITSSISKQNTVFLANTGGGINADASTYSLIVRPTLYLNLNVRILSGNGTLENPYILS